MEKKIHKLNEAIGQCIARDLGVTDVVIFGLAEPVLIRDHESDTTSPAIVSPGGECQVVYDALDSAKITIYSRLQNVAYETKPMAFGDSHGYEQVADVSVVVFGKRCVNQYLLEKTITRALSSDVDVVLQSADFNAIQVWSSEFPGVPYFINPDYFLFKVNYKVSTDTERCHKH